MVYLDHQSVVSQERQHALLRHEIADQVAANVVSEIQRTLSGPVFDTLTAVNHPVLKAGRLDLVFEQFREGLNKYPQVDRFFVWSDRTESVAPGEVLFLDRRSEVPDETDRASSPDRALTEPVSLQALQNQVRAFGRDPSMSGVITRAAKRHSPSQQIYFAVERIAGNTLQDVFVRLFWTDAGREHYFAMLGFVVDLASVHTTLFPELVKQGLGPILRGGGSSLEFDLRVFDERGDQVFGPTRPAAPRPGEATFPLQFYPAESIRTRTSAGIDPRTWRMTVEHVRDTGVYASWPGPPHYLLSGLSVVLMMVALILAVHSHRRAIQLSRMQTDFVSHVSHQLRTPLALLSAVSETLGLARAHPPEKLSQYLDIVRSETARLSALVERILQFSRVDGQQGRAYEFEPTDLYTLVQETVAAFSRRLGTESQITFEESEGRPRVAADPAALEQVLVNLLDNALKYSDDDKRVVVRVASSGPDAIVTVTDHGIGIQPADQRHIFEKFYRVAGASHSRDGFGVGLSIVRQLITAHRGTVEVASTPGEGSTFTIRLPRLSESYKEANVAVPDVAQAKKAV